VGAVVTLLRAWLEKGCPSYSGKNANRFSGWAAIIGGVLETIGVPGFLSNVAESLDCLDPEDTAWQAFVAAWHDRFDQRPVTTADLLPLAIGECDETGTLKEDSGALADYVDAKDDTGRKKRLGRALAERRDRVYAGYRLTRLPNTKTPQYRLDRGGLGGFGGFSQSNAGEYFSHTHDNDTPLAASDENPSNPPNPPSSDAYIPSTEPVHFGEDDAPGDLSDLTDPFAEDDDEADEAAAASAEGFAP
jgi:hypothetical protein